MEVMMASIWTDAIIYDEATGGKHRVIERYSLPGKGTGAVLVCCGRQVYWQLRDYVEWLVELPDSIHYEDRKKVVKFTERIIQELRDAAFDVATDEETYMAWTKRMARRIDNEDRDCEGK
jgi:hypothetical protein|tara:strand:+ start:558 stop:917 length:360 start_codon:yes stop_codon:yes gene_type:complete